MATARRVVWPNPSVEVRPDGMGPLQGHRALSFRGFMPSVPPLLERWAS